MSGPVAHIDPAEARDFIADLGGTIDFYRKVVDRLEANVGRLGKTWQDRQFADFAQEVKTLRQGLTTYVEQAASARTSLDRLATHAEEYHKIQQR